MKRKPEAAFEKRVKEYYEANECVCFHLVGPAGWPDLFVEHPASGKCLHVEIKKTTIKAWRELKIADVFEPAQLNFPALYKINVFSVMETPDGVFMTMLRCLHAPDEKIGALPWVEWKQFT